MEQSDDFGEDDDEDVNTGASAFASVAAGIVVTEGNDADAEDCGCGCDCFDMECGGDVADVAKLLVIGDMKGKNARDEMLCPSTLAQVEDTNLSLRVRLRCHCLILLALSRASHAL